SSLAIRESGLEDDLGPAQAACVAVLVRLDGTLERQLVGDDPGRVGLSYGDQIPEPLVVFLDRAPATAEGLAFAPVQPVLDGYFALVCEMAGAARMGGDETANDADSAG